MQQHNINLRMALDAGIRMLQSDTFIPAKDKTALVDLEKLLIGLQVGELVIQQNPQLEMPRDDAGEPPEPDPMDDMG